MNYQDYEYAGLWIRIFQALVDTCLWYAVTLPIYIFVYGDDYFSKYFESEDIFLGATDIWLSWIIPAIVVVSFWVWKSATPGKILTKTKIVDQASGGAPTFVQFVKRYFGYYVSGAALGLGIIWIAFDKRKQGWHDKIAGTVVIRERPIEPHPVSFGENVQGASHSRMNASDRAEKAIHDEPASSKHFAKKSSDTTPKA